MSTFKNYCRKTAAAEKRNAEAQKEFNKTVGKSRITTNKDGLYDTKEIAALKGGIKGTYNLIHTSVNNACQEIVLHIGQYNPYLKVILPKDVYSTVMASVTIDKESGKLTDMNMLTVVADRLESALPENMKDDEGLVHIFKSMPNADYSVTRGAVLERDKNGVPTKWEEDVVKGGSKNHTDWTVLDGKVDEITVFEVLIQGYLFEGIAPNASAYNKLFKSSKKESGELHGLSAAELSAKKTAMRKSFSETALKDLKAMREKAELEAAKKNAKADKNASEKK